MNPLKKSLILIYKSNEQTSLKQARFIRNSFDYLEFHKIAQNIIINKSFHYNQSEVIKYD